MHRVALTRTLRIPVFRLTDASSNDPAHRNGAALAIWPGAMDEAPEGPSGFDVFDDGSVVVADPMLRRLVVYDAGGSFLRACPLEFPPDSVKVTPDGLLLVRQANTGEMHMLDRDGKTHAETTALPDEPMARVLSANSGTVPGIGRGAPSVITVHFDEPGSTLLSLERIAGRPGAETFVAVESTVPGESSDSISLRKSVRRYSAAGVLLSESAAIPLDYYVLPVDELRVCKGVIYQLLTTPVEVHINEWDTN